MTCMKQGPIKCLDQDNNVIDENNLIYLFDKGNINLESLNTEIRLMLISNKTN